MKRKSIIQVFSICAALIFVLLTSGCVGPTVRVYEEDKLPEGDKLPTSEFAVIKGGYDFYLLGGHRIYIWRIGYTPTEATEVEVSPGRHKLFIKHFTYYLLGGSSSRCVLDVFNFEAGHEYKIKYLYKGIFREGVKIIDVTTGAMIFSQPWSECW